MCAPGQEMCTMSHLYANVTFGYVRRDSQPCDVFIQVTYSHMWRDSFTYVTWQLVYVTRLICLTHVYVHHDSKTCAPWLMICVPCCMWTCAQGDHFTCNLIWVMSDWHIHIYMYIYIFIYIYINICICRCESCASSFIDVCAMTHIYASGFTDIFLCAQHDYLICVSRLLHWPSRQFDSMQGGWEGKKAARSQRETSRWFFYQKSRWLQLKERKRSTVTRSE